ncbi:MAG TPA: hypothetical protein VEK73_01755 [Xanthobacteraceae bacterium]|nr:hypothetical protein [Xanthobacteraceae bacterium]
MQDNVIVAGGSERAVARGRTRTLAHGWLRGVDAEAWKALECVSLFCLLGLLVTAVVLFGSSPETVAAMTAAMSQ